MDMKHKTKYLSAAIIALALLVPIQGHADQLTSLIAALFGSGSAGSSSGSGDVIGRPSQVIPDLNAILDRLRNNGEINLGATKNQTATDIQRTNYLAQTNSDRLRLVRDNQITSDYPELSNLACGIASINESVPAIELASQNATAQVIDILTNGMYQNLISGTMIASKRKHDIWCKLGAIADDDKCTPDPLIVGCDRDRHSCIARKDSIPCNMRAVQQEFVKMANEGYTPGIEHRECIAAILSIANEFELSNALPTKEELKTSQGIMIRDQKKNAIAREWATKGGALQEFADVVSVDESSAPDCKKACGGSNDVCSILRKVYGNAVRPNGVAPYGMPPSGYCLSPFQIAWGKELAIDQSMREDIGKMDWQQAIVVNTFVNREKLNTRRDRRNSFKPNTVGAGNTLEAAARPVGENNTNTLEQLTQAMRQLTSEIKVMNKGVYSNKAQQVRQQTKSNKGIQKQNPLDVSSDQGKSAEVTDALKEMGLKVSSPAIQPGGVLPPITPEFPVLPPQ